MILECLEKALQGRSLTAEQAAGAMEEILSGEASLTQWTSFLVALAMKGESEEELLGMARTLRAKTNLPGQYGPVEVGHCGGSRRAVAAVRERKETSKEGGPFDISIAAAFVAAGAGVRLLWQECICDDGWDASNVLEELGVGTRLPVAQIARGVAEVGLGFVLQPLVHAAMEQTCFAIREVPVPNAFHLLLSTLNPGNAPAVVSEVHSAGATETAARLLARLGVKCAFVVGGGDGLAEIAAMVPATLAELREGQVAERQIHPADFGLPPAPLEDMAARGASDSAQIIRSVLGGEAGPRRHAVLMNAALAIVCAGKAKDLAEGARRAADAVDSGRALAALETLKQISQSS